MTIYTQTNPFKSENIVNFNRTNSTDVRKLNSETEQCEPKNIAGLLRHLEVRMSQVSDESKDSACSSTQNESKQRVEKINTRVLYKVNA